jgi:hypothetical protein
MGIVDGTTPARGGDASEDDLKWLMRDDMPRKPAWPWRMAFKFQAGDDWLKNLSIVAANRTWKKIVFMRVFVSFPELKQSNGVEGGVGTEITLGRLPAIAAYDRNGNPFHLGDEPSLELHSGYKISISFARDEPMLRGIVEKWQPFSTVSQCYVILKQVWFADGMHWDEGSYYYRPDPDHLGRYLRMESSYFPGGTK